MPPKSQCVRDFWTHSRDMRFARPQSSVRTALGLLVLAAFASAEAGTGTYTFNNTLSALEASSPSLTAVNPLGQNVYGNAFLYGANRATYNTSGVAGDFANNAGLLLNASSLVTATQYSLEMVVSLSTTDGYRKLADISNRTADSGYYILNSHQNVYPVVDGTIPTTSGTYNYLVLTVSNDTVKGYVNGVLDFTATTSVMDGNAFSFFLDDSGTGGREYSNVSVGLLRLRDSVLTDAQVATLAVNPYQAVPEPTTLAALGLGAFGLLHRRRRA